MLAKYSILVVNGPNLNMLGVREPEIYGHETLKDLEKMLQNVADELDVKIEFYQSNHEGDIVDTIQQSYKKVDFILLNAGAYTHTSGAIRDALAGIDMPFYEIHISNVHKREEFRHHSFLSDVAVGVIVGFGLDGYEFALRGAVRYLDRKHQE
ncbi:MAG: type II 3-dehydroquinate dehydratase [Succinivibrio sp.]|nr:type II 3-dehydroquinate dehydratase [Succinivibrio sp.]